jgi:hypothetical protein
VPFGPRASQAGVVEIEEPPPVRPDDFWGEGSAAIHDVLQGPPSGVALAPTRAVSSPRRGRLGVWLDATWRRARVIGARARVALAGARVGGRPVALVAGGLAAVAASAIAVGRVEAGHNPSAAHVPARAGAQAAWTQAGRDPGPLTAAKGPGLMLLAARGAAPARRATVLRRQRAAVKRASSSRGATTSSYAGSSASPPPTYAATSVAPASSGTRASVASASARSAPSDAGQAAGPQGPGAPFGPVRSG